METLILFILVSLSITNIIQNESIFAPIRRLIMKLSEPIYNFVICPTCFGFWVGVAISYFFHLDPNWIVNLFMCGFVSSIVNKLYVSLGLVGFSID